MLNNGADVSLTKGVAVSSNRQPRRFSRYDVLSNAMADDKENISGPRVAIALFNASLTSLTIEQLDSLRSALTTAIVKFNKQLDTVNSVFAYDMLKQARRLAENQLTKADSELLDRYAEMTV